MAPEPQNVLVLPLERSRTARAFEASESLWEPELRRIYKLLEKHIGALRAAKEQSGDSDEKLPVLSIAIFGTSGSGKTSLLKTLAAQVNLEKQRLPPEIKDNIRSLRVMKPNVMAKDEHFLYAFLATALEEDYDRHKDQRSQTLTRVQKEFQDVSEYLQVIDEVERPHEYDPLGFSLERLERHTSGLRLREKLGSLLKALADEFPKVVLLPVDDADMSQDSLISTLDTFNRYLRHPQLVPIFTLTGRLAEELLKVHVGRNLSSQESQKISKGLDQPSATLPMVESLALQQMEKLFPIRNRIRLGPAPARVLAASYRHAGDQGKDRHDGGNGPEKVWKLLETASNLLFGPPQWPIAPRVRISFRPPTLRRQLQILDAMHDSEVGRLRKDKGSGKGKDSGKDKAPSWATVFDRATWSLLNVHRDVLREHQMYIEELYSLSPRNLSRHILSSMLSLNLETRREILQHWRFQEEDRRGQILSLLALNAFQPRLDTEEATGDDPDAIYFMITGEKKTRRREKPTEIHGEGNFIPATQAITWFLDLWIGFYLPQILARNRRNDIGQSKSDKPELGGFHGVGWNLRSGPANAMEEVLRNGEVSAVGMMQLDAKKFSEVLNKQSKLAERRQIQLAIHLWCSYGHKSGKPWAAVSLWRGLGLLGQILDDYERLRLRPPKKEESPKDHEAHRVLRIETLIEKHCAAAKAPGSPQDDPTAFGAFNPKDLKNEIKRLAHQIERWIQGKLDGEDKEEYILPLDIVVDLKTPEEKIDKNYDRLVGAFENSFIRRLHGEHLVGQLWPALGSFYLEGPTNGSAGKNGAWVNAWAALERWSLALHDYWNPEEPGKQPQTQKLKLARLFEDCPLLQPFLQNGEERGERWIDRENLEGSFSKLIRAAQKNIPYVPETGEKIEATRG